MIVGKVEDSESWNVIPKAGYLLKFKDINMNRGELGEDEKRKCFVNVCHCTELPPPAEDVDEETLAARIDAGDLGYRIPLSVGEIDCVRDKRDENSVKIDVLVNSVFFEKHLKPAPANFFRHFFCMVMCDAIEHKHGLNLDANKAVKLQNRLRMGELGLVRIAKKPTAPVIQDVTADTFNDLKSVNSAESINDPMEAKQPEGVSVRLLKGERLEIRLSLERIDPPVQSDNRLRLLMNDDRLMLLLDKSRSVYDFCLPFQMDLSSIQSKLLIEKKALVVSAKVIYP